MSEPIKPDNKKQAEQNKAVTEEQSKTVPNSGILTKLRHAVAILLQNKIKLLKINAISLILILLYFFFIARPYYKSSVVILPDYGNKTSEMIGQLSGLASLAGMSVGDTPPTQIYQSLILSESILSEVIYTKYQTKEFDRPVNLIEYFELDPDEDLPLDLQRRKMFLELYEKISKDNIKLDFNKTTKILTITVEMPESKLSADVANNIPLALNDYILTQRKSFAIEQRKYLERRVNQVWDTLFLLEENLKNFRVRNRVIAQSPELILEQSRLIRSVEIQQALYGELVKQFELVKLQEVKQTPVINVKEKAQEPILKAGPKRFLWALILLFISVVLTSLFCLGKERMFRDNKLIKQS